MNPNNNKSEYIPRVIPSKSTNEAIKLMMDIYKSSKAKKDLKDREREEERKKINENRNLSTQHRIFQNQRDDVNISQRVSDASQSHLRHIENIGKVTQRQPTPSKLNPFQNNLQTTQAQQKEPNRTVAQPAQQRQSQTGLFVQKTTTTKTPANILSVTQPANNIFGNLNNGNMIFQSKPQGNIFTQPPQQTQVQKPAVNIFNKPQVVQNSNVFGKKTVAQPSQPSVGGLFGKNSQVTPQSTQSIFNLGNKVDGGDKKETQLTTQLQSTQQEKPKDQQQPQKKVNIFSQGLFQENSKKPKPVLIFNNNIKTQPQSDKKQKLLTPNKQPAVKILFNNNGAVVDNIKPKFNIFDGGKPIQQQVAQSQGSSPVQSQKTISGKHDIFQAPKTQINTQAQKNIISNKQQQPHKQEPKVNLVSSNQPTNIFNSQPSPNVFTNSSQQTSLFKNPATQQQALFGNINQNKSLFPIQQLSSQSQTTRAKPTLFGNNNASNLFSQISVPSHKQQNSQMVSESKQVQQPPVKEEKSQNQNIFVSQGNSIFGKKPQPENKPTPTGGLFNITQTSNVFDQPKKQVITFGNANNNNKLEEVKKPADQGKVSFQQSLKSSKMFDNSQQGGVFGGNSQQGGVFGGNSQQGGVFGGNSQQGGVFGGNTSTNMFGGKVNNNNNPFSNIAQNQNMFSQNKGASLFQQSSQVCGAALFQRRQDVRQDQQQGQDGDIEGERQGADGLVHSEYGNNVGNGEMMYNDYIKTTEFAKVDAVKFKIVRAESILLEQMKFSIQQLEGDSNIYIIVRTPTKIPKFYGILHAGSQLKKIKDTDIDLSISIKKIIQIDLLFNNKKSLEQWRILFKKSPQSVKFVKEVEKIIQDHKNKQSNK